MSYDWEGLANEKQGEINRLRAELAVKDEVARGLMAALVERNDAIADARAELANVHRNAEMGCPPSTTASRGSDIPLCRMWYAEKLQAEAEVRNLRAELDDDYRASMDQLRMDKAEAAIGRVRGLCETQGLRGRHIATHTEILRALEPTDGDTE